LEDDFGDLVGGASVIDGTSYVELEFMATIHGREHADVDEAPSSPVQAFASPYRAPAVLHDEIL
jgi:hypothetical protein